MQGVVTFVFVVWLGVALAVYAYRIWRRVTQGPKAVREARAATQEGRAAGLALGVEGPSPAPVRPAVAESAPTGAGAARPSLEDVPTVADALRGIELPCDLVPIVDPDHADAASGHRVVFTTRTASVRTVTAALADALEALGYRVADSAVDPSGERRQLVAGRTGLTVSVTVSADGTGTVAAQVSTQGP